MGKNENVAASPSAPQRTPSSEAPKACAASSSSASPCRLQIAPSGPIAAGWPNRCTGMTARVRGVIAASTAAGSRL